MKVAMAILVEICDWGDSVVSDEGTARASRIPRPAAESAATQAGTRFGPVDCGGGGSLFFLLDDRGKTQF